MAIKQFTLSAVTTAAAGEMFSNTVVTGDPMIDLILKIALPIITGLIAPSITKLVDAWVYKIKNSVQTKKQNQQNEKNSEEKPDEKS